MPEYSGNGHRAVCGGFTLVEALVGTLLLSLFMLAGFSAIVFNRVLAIKTKEKSITVDFLVHYGEMVRGMPFETVLGGNPINPLFDGSGGAPNIRLPRDSGWVAINTTNYETFHPDLVWLHNREPQMQVKLEIHNMDGRAHDKHLNLKVAWDSPLGRGGRLQTELDLVRVKDL